MLEKRNFYINGAWVAPAAANDYAVIDPSTEEQCAVISLGDKADTDAAVSAARAAFDSWRQRRACAISASCAASRPVSRAACRHLSAALVPLLRLPHGIVIQLFKG